MVKETKMFETESGDFYRTIEEALNAEEDDRLWDELHCILNINGSLCNVIIARKKEIKKVLNEMVKDD